MVVSLKDWNRAIEFAENNAPIFLEEGARVLVIGTAKPGIELADRLLHGGVTKVTLRAVKCAGDGSGPKIRGDIPPLKLDLSISEN